MIQEARRFQRTTVGTDVRISFVFAGHRFQDIHVSTLGAGGCGFLAPDSLLALLDVMGGSSVLDQVYLDHPQLPEQPLQARIVYTVGHGPVMIGLEFLDLPDDFHDLLAHLVHGLLQHPRTHSDAE